MVKCDFSGVEIPKGTGKIFVRKDGKMLNFLNSKCEKNYLSLKRKPRKIKWTEEYYKEKRKHLVKAKAKKK